MKTKKENNSVLKAAIGTAVIVISFVVIALLINVLFPFKRFEPSLDVSKLFLISTILSSLVGAMAIYLIFIYLKNYFYVKSKFTLGIVLVMVAFFGFAITSNPILLSVFGIYGRFGLFSLVPMLFAVISLAVLTWISSR